MHRKRRCEFCCRSIDLDLDEHITILVTRWQPDKYKKTVQSKSYYHAHCKPPS